MSSLLAFSVALGVALAIGLERERSHAATQAEVPAGIRTFAIAGLAGALAASLPPALAVLAVPALVLAGTLVAAVGYHHTARVDPGATTELALIATTLLGAYAVSAPDMAAAMGTVLLALLHGKAALHRFAQTTLTQRELADLLILAVAALLIWPAIPDRAMGPFAAWNPHTLWLVVILVMLTGNAGHFASRWLGERIGLPLAGLFGGFASSVATVAAMGARVRSGQSPRDRALAAALLSCVATVVQMALLIAAIDVALLRPLGIPLAAALIVTVVSAGVNLARKTRPEPGAEGHADTASSIDWRAAIGFGLWMAALLLASAAARAWIGMAAVTAVTLVGALADVHAATAAIASQAAASAIGPASARTLILLALTANTATKVIAATSGGRAFAVRLATGLLLALAAAWLVAGWLS
jgi:uncharacterized membrane protein (DUF4010 family)